MKKTALIFPGQGVQKVGMGREFYDASTRAKEIFDKADAILQNGLKDVIFNGPQDKLTQTAYSQPAILTCCVAIFKAFEVSEKFKNIHVEFTAGLSLGEYPALVVCQALDFENTLRLVERRSSLMEEACTQSEGKMAAVIGFDKARLMDICRKTGAQVANFNSHEQIVITGHAQKVEEACQIIEQQGAKSVIPLNVSGGFHSSLMQPASDKFQMELRGIPFQNPPFPLISNVSARPTQNAEEIRQNLGRQIVSSVLWVDTIELMAKQGIRDFIEIGPGRVLKGLIRKIDSSLKVHNIQTPEDIEKIPF